jgi:beta-N-acetylhexosaminidase
MSIRSALCCFGANCKEPDQVRALVAEMRDAVGRADAPVLIDQEGGRVARLQPPHWRNYPAAAQIGALPDPRPKKRPGSARG